MRRLAVLGFAMLLLSQGALAAAGQIGLQKTAGEEAQLNSEKSFRLAAKVCHLSSDCTRKCCARFERREYNRRQAEHCQAECCR